MAESGLDQPMATGVLQRRVIPNVLFTNNSIHKTTRYNVGGHGLLRC